MVCGAVSSLPNDCLRVGLQGLGRPAAGGIPLVSNNLIAGLKQYPRRFIGFCDANFLCRITASTEAEVERLLSRARSEYARCPELTFRLDPQRQAHLRRG